MPVFQRTGFAQDKKGFRVAIVLVDKRDKKYSCSKTYW
jgi:hypothetical protein